MAVERPVTEQEIFIPQLDKGRLPVRIDRIIVPEGARELLEKLQKPETPYSESESCWTCDENLPLQHLNFQSVVGHTAFRFKGAPGYHCKPCDSTYFPREVLNALSEVVEKELAVLNPQPKFVNPDRIKPY